MARLDERVAQGEINRANERTSNLKSGLDVAKTAGSFALGGGAFTAGSKLMSRVSPFLSEFITPELAIKGINKISPKLGGILNAGIEMGLKAEDGINFLRENLNNESEPAKQNGNIIEQYSPELFKFMEQSIAKGESPLQASSTARKSKKEFNDAIKKMEADHKMSWDQIVASVFGQEAKAMQPKQEQSPLQRMLSPAENPQEQTAAQQAAMQLMGSGQAQQPMQPQQMQQQGQGGQGEQRLLAALQELKKLRGG